VLEIPLMEIVVTPGAEGVCRKASRLGLGDWLVFTSKNAATIYLESISEKITQRIACVGPLTAAVFEGAGVSVDFISQGGDASNLASEFLAFLNNESTECRVCFLRGRLASSIPAEKLRAAGYEAEEYVIYDSVERSLDETARAELAEALKRGASILLFTNAESVRTLVDSCDGWNIPLATFQKCPVAAIGSRTAARLKSHGFTVDFMPARPSLELLVKEILARSAVTGEAEAEKS